MPIVRRVVLLLLICLAAMPLAGQTVAPGKGPSKAPLDQAKKQGLRLPADLTVKGNVTAQAVLIPPDVAEHVFGGEIADNYAVIELTVTNKSPDAALVVQGIYIDYTNWALSGSVRPDEICAEGLEADSKSSFQSCTRPNQVASEEYRVVRGQLLEMRPWTKRNKVTGALTLLGSVLSAYSFSIKELGYSKGIAAFTGTVVPGIKAFVPDQTVDEMNRISDVGYRTPMIISKQGANIIVCFFPIKRFLSESFVEFFKKNPAVFFSPFEILVDESLQKKLVKKLPEGLASKFRTNQDRMQELLPCYLRVKASNTPLPPRTDGTEVQIRERASNQIASNTQTTTSTTNTTQPESPSKQLENKLTQKCLNDVLKDPSTTQILDMIGRMSLNNIRVVIDGVMSVETTTLPARIISLEFDGEKTDSTLWTNTSTTKTGKIEGAYLTGGTLKILNADKFIKGIKAVTEGSTDETLKFAVTLKDIVPDQTELTFVVEKKAKDRSGAEKTIESNPYTYQVQYPVPKIESVEFEQDKEPNFWTKTSTAREGKIKGAYLNGGTPRIVEMKEFGITDVEAISGGSDDKILKFSLKLAKPIKDGTDLTFVVEKTVKDSRGAEKILKSGQKTYTVTYVPGPQPKAATQPRNETERSLKAVSSPQ